MIRIAMLGPGDESVLASVALGVFDHAVDPGLAAEFLSDPRHHIVVAMDGTQVVGFASGVHYIHPDKAPEFWINEVGVAASHRKQSVGKKLLHALFEAARELGCTEAWVLTERTNAPAIRLYASSGGVEPSGEAVMFLFKLA
ncbi:MAG: GNAT family N-acetyltransferase [Gemmatimonadales bacterium]|jgi:ribosomal protein S18 acetylase RimI-like enzyme|nr:MAG: GNAT family N-acetyltransferase [Gemmatimonadales bacterium]